MSNAGAGKCFDILSMQATAVVGATRPADAPSGSQLCSQRVHPRHHGEERHQDKADLDQRDELERCAGGCRATSMPAGDTRPAGALQPIAYQRAHGVALGGVLSFWYFKRADDTWLHEQRPEAYFQMAEPDLPCCPVYGTMKQLLTTAVLYRGSTRPMTGKSLTGRLDAERWSAQPHGSGRAGRQ